MDGKRYAEAAGAVNPMGTDQEKETKTRVNS